MAVQTIQPVTMHLCIAVEQYHIAIGMQHHASVDRVDEAGIDRVFQQGKSGFRSLPQKALNPGSGLQSITTISQAVRWGNASTLSKQRRVSSIRDKPG